MAFWFERRLRIFLFIGAFCFSAHQCLNLNDDYEIVDSFVKTENASLKVSTTKSLIVKDALDCALMCLEETECFSFNMVKQSSEHGIICEILPVDMHHPSSPTLIVNASSNHHSPRDPCVPNRCVSGDPRHFCTRLYKKPGSRYQCRSKTTCHQIKTTYPSFPSASYIIDPDGESGTPPFTVYCDMVDRNGTGVTVISHDSEVRSLVDGSEGAGSFIRSVTYNGVSIDQLKALTAASSHCEQFLKYECHGSVLSHFSGSDQWFGWWVSRDGDKMTSWGGAPIGSGKCACGVDNSCAGRKRCNCENNDAKWREDSGLLTSKNHLPVIQLRFGDTGGTSERGYYTLGKLKCY